MDEKTGSLAGFARAQMRWTLNQTPLDEAERADVVDGIRRCHEAVDLPWHGVVVWVPSPLAGLMAATAASRFLTPPYATRTLGLATRFPAVARLPRAAAERVPVAPLCAVAVLVVAVTAAALAGPAVHAAPVVVHSFTWSLLMGIYFLYLPTAFFLYYLYYLRNLSPGVVRTAAGATAVSLAWWCGATLLSLTTASVGVAIGLWRAGTEVDLAAVAGYSILAVFASAMALGGAWLDGWRWRQWWSQRWDEKPVPEQTAPSHQIAQARADADRQLWLRMDPLRASEVRETVVAPITSLERQFSTTIRAGETDPWAVLYTGRHRCRRAGHHGVSRGSHALVRGQVWSSGSPR